MEDVARYQGERLDGLSHNLGNSRGRRRGLRVLAGIVGVLGVGLLLGGCNFAGGLWHATEDVVGPFGNLGRQIQSTLGGPFQSACG